MFGSFCLYFPSALNSFVSAQISPQLVDRNEYERHFDRKGFRLKISADFLNVATSAVIRPMPGLSIC